jgi:predicted transcriptional regulator YdeE
MRTQIFKMNVLIFSLKNKKVIGLKQKLKIYLIQNYTIIARMYQMFMKEKKYLIRRLQNSLG